MARQSHRKAFTIVELLVVISIIAMLSAILLPAVNQAREAGRQSVCSNNMRQLGQAVQLYSTSKNSLPPYMAPLIAEPTNVNESLWMVGYVYHILPNIEKGPVRDAIERMIDGDGNPADRVFNAATNGNSPFDPTYLSSPSGQPIANNYGDDYYSKILICPTDPPVTDTRSGPLSYVANGGQADSTHAGTQDTPIDWPANGAMGRTYLTEAMVNAGINASTTTIDSISANDGTTQTVLLTENVRADNWTPVYDEGGTGIHSDGFYELRQTVVWNSASDSIVNGGMFEGFNIAIEQDLKDLGLTNPTLNFLTPSSRHAGGFVMTFCDGHTVFVQDQIDYRVYAKLITSNGNGARVPGESLVLNGGRPVPNPIWQRTPVSESDYEAL